MKEQSRAFRAAWAAPPAQRERQMLRLGEAGDVWAQAACYDIFDDRGEAAAARGDTQAADEEYARALRWVRLACVCAP